MRTFCLLLIALATLPIPAAVAADPPAAPTATFTLWQLPQQTHSQMMSYVLRTAGGKILVLDGGTAGDAPYLRGFLGALGNKVEAWFITHPHSDHINALTEMAHHGQNGVGKDVYRAIAPSHCLWPTPRRLWDNDAGKGKGTGPWKTLEVRAWMDELSIKSRYVSADGLQRIE